MSDTQKIKIPLIEPFLNGNELNYIKKCFQSNWISSTGEFVSKFEKKFSDYFKIPYALAVSNGTSALHLALLTLEIGPGDEVIVPDFTFASPINMILQAGAKPVLVDICEKTLTIDVKKIEEKITPATKAIIPVHLYGYPCAMGPILDLSKKYNLHIIEDCAEAIGSTYREKLIGTFGDISTFSFFANKTITTGEGGMVLFKDKTAYKNGMVLRDHGMSREKRYWHEKVGFNYRMTNLQAAIGCAQMERIDDLIESKVRIGETYNHLLKDVPYIQLPHINKEIKNTFWLYTIQLEENCSMEVEKLQEKLMGKGIETRRTFFPIHQMPPYRSFCGEGEVFIVSSKVSKSGLSLPSSLTLSEKQLYFVCDCLKNALKSQ